MFSAIFKEFHGRFIGCMFVICSTARTEGLVLGSDLARLL